MAKIKLIKHTITEEEQRVLVNLFKDPLATKAFLNFLSEVKQEAKHDAVNISQTFLMNNDPVTRALALQQKGKVDLLEELITLVQTVVK